MSARINYPHCERNLEPITKVVTEQIECSEGQVLEIGSGSGQHITGLAKALEKHVFWPTDPDGNHRQSITEWTRHFNLENVMPPQAIDASFHPWKSQFDSVTPERFDAILCFNVIHIAPVSVASGLFKGGSDYLKSEGKIILYGPYKIDGRHTAESNARFDASLKARNPQWGIRDISTVEAEAEQNGFELQALIPMPANNFMPVFTKV